MKIAVPAEVKNNEYRVAITPAGVHDLVANGHEVLVQSGAGLGSSSRGSFCTSGVGATRALRTMPQWSAAPRPGYESPGVVGIGSTVR